MKRPKRQQMISSKPDLEFKIGPQSMKVYKSVPKSKPVVTTPEMKPKAQSPQKENVNGTQNPSAPNPYQNNNQAPWGSIFANYVQLNNDFEQDRRSRPKNLNVPRSHSGDHAKTLISSESPQEPLPLKKKLPTFTRIYAQKQQLAMPFKRRQSDSSFLSSDSIKNTASGKKLPKFRRSSIPEQELKPKPTSDRSNISLTRV